MKIFEYSRGVHKKCYFDLFEFDKPIIHDIWKTYRDELDFLLVFSDVIYHNWD